jgi:drug/metabolite transporter (DMT)-like permease
VPIIIVLVIIAFAFSRGSQRILTHLALEEIDGWTITLTSLLLSCVIWLPIAYYKKWLIWDKSLWYRSIPLSIFNIALPGLSFTFAQMFVSAGVAALFVSFLPAVVAILGIVVLKEKVSKLSWAGIILGLAGIVMLVVSKNGSLDATNWWVGIMLLVGGVVSAAIVYVGWRKLLSERPAVEIIAPQLVISTIFVAPIALIFGNINDFHSAPWVVLSLLAVSNYIIPQIAMFWLLVRTTALTSATANYLAPVFAVVLGVIFLDQPLTIIIAVSGLMIVLGAILINVSKKKSISKEN